jgi:hypothetical protein
MSKYYSLLKADLLGILFQQLPLKEGGLDALAVAVGLVPLADDGDQIALLCVICWKNTLSRSDWNKKYYYCGKGRCTKYCAAAFLRLWEPLYKEEANCDRNVKDKNI